MQAMYLEGKMPSVYPQFMVDDFGNEVMAVGSILEGMNSFQVKMDPNTYWHIFDLTAKVYDWRDGHYEE